MTEEEIIEEFTDIMVEKLQFNVFGGTPEEVRRQEIRQVITDAFLLKDGLVPIERWRE